MWNRKSEKKLKLLLKKFPCVCILGARQVGKTTLVKNTFRESNYFDLESITVSSRISLDPEGFLRSFKNLVILDEIQSIPELTQSLKVVIDEDREKNGRFIILGSAHPSLIKKASESLAGRVAFIDLETLSQLEYNLENSKEKLNDLWINGGYPTICQDHNTQFKSEWFDSYLKTFIERDLSSYNIDIQPQLMRKLILMISHLHGQQWNASAVASSAGITYHTANRYLNILDSAFIARILKPYHVNIKKRLVKSGKVYLRDSGIYHHLLQIQSLDALLSSPYAGNSWEGYIIEEIIKQFSFHIKNPNFYYYRTHTGLEADLILDFGTNVIPIEIKLGSNIQKKWISNLKTVMEDVKAETGILIYSGEDSFELGNIKVVSASNNLDIDKIFNF